MSEALPEQVDGNWDINKRTLHAQLVDATASNYVDTVTNDAFLATLEPTSADILYQVSELTRQSTRRAEELTGLIRLVLGRLESTSSVIT
ncbi:hypothetical protein [Streptomyces chrestomyceticus]|uniref:hypothetical protein n=1 Tax=Streptomyces chrestomyceticus TaxID=68185 RepID=UPI0033F7A8EB